MAALKVTEQVRDARATAASKALRKGSGGAPARSLMGFVLIGGVICCGLVYAYLVFGAKEVEAHETYEATDRWDAEEMRARLPTLRRPKEVVVTREVERDPESDTREAAPAAAPTPRSAPMRMAFNWDEVHLRAAGPIAAVPAPATESRSSGGEERRSYAHMRHVPRGTRLGPCVLETPVVSDNLDGLIQVRLLEEYVVRGEVVFPENTLFIADVRAVQDRWQKLVEVQVTNAILDGEREVEMQGLLLDVTGPHLEASKVKYHTGRATLGIAALATMGAVSGYAGRTSGSIPALAGAETASGLTDLAEKRVERVLDRPPTLFVEQGRLCWVMVSESFDQPIFASLPVFQPGEARSSESFPTMNTPGFSGETPEMQMVLGRLEELRGAAEELKRR